MEEKIKDSKEKIGTHRGRLTFAQVMRMVVLHFKEIIAFVAITIACVLIADTIGSIAEGLTIVRDNEYREVRVTLYSEDKEILEQYEGQYHCNNSGGTVYMENRDGTAKSLVCGSGYIVVDYLDKTKEDTSGE